MAFSATWKKLLIVLCKLNFYRIRGPFFKLIKSYLTNRYQSVLIGGMSSAHSRFLECCKINHGVPQGSILGPLLFLFYVHDLPKIVQYNSQLTLFAYDTSLILSNPNHLDFKTNNNTDVFSHLNKWFDNNSLFLNYEKNSICTFYPQRHCSSGSIHWL